MPLGPKSREGHLAAIAHLDDLDLVIGPSVEPVLPPEPDSVMAALAALDGDDARRDLHVIVHQCEKRIEVSPVDGLDASVHKLHVLLRHRSRSIPQPR